MIVAQPPPGQFNAAFNCAGNQFWTVLPTTFSMLYALAGNVVWLDPVNSGNDGTPNGASSPNYSGMPAAIRPSVTRNIVAGIVVNGLFSMGQISISPGGLITINNYVSGGTEAPRLQIAVPPALANCGLASSVMLSYRL